MELLSICELEKNYSSFHLDRVSFSLEAGTIMGFIGRNGAGKTTTLKTLLGLVHPDGGSVTMFGRNFFEHQRECRQELGLVLGDGRFYPQKRLRDIADVISRLYTNWNEALFKDYLQKFSLDEAKRIKELSTGMWVKFSLALALSHGARLLILDEPTSGLDPVSREELMEIFLELVSDGERSILFSTHIISDLERCADYITYIQNGRILASKEKEAFMEDYLLISGASEQLSASLSERLIGKRAHKFGFEALVRQEDAELFTGCTLRPASLEEIMLHLERGEL